MTEYRGAIALVVALLFVGCTRPPDESLNLKVSSADPVVVEEVRRILMFRFREFRPSFFSSVESTVDGSMLSFRFKGGAPAQPVVTYLYETPGKVRATLAETSDILFTDQDIEQAALAYENESHVVRLRLAREAGDRVLALTKRNVGKTARLTLDGRVLLEAVIAGVLRASFQITSPEQDRGKGNGTRSRAAVRRATSGCLLGRRYNIVALRDVYDGSNRYRRGCNGERDDAGVRGKIQAVPSGTD